MINCQSIQLSVCTKYVISVYLTSFCNVLQAKWTCNRNYHNRAILDVRGENDIPLTISLLRVRLKSGTENEIKVLQKLLDSHVKAYCIRFIYGLSLMKWVSISINRECSGDQLTGNVSTETAIDFFSCHVLKLG